MGQKCGLKMGHPKPLTFQAFSDFHPIQDHFRFTFPGFALTGFSGDFHSRFSNLLPEKIFYLPLPLISHQIPTWVKNMGQADSTPQEQNQYPTPILIFNKTV